MRAVKEKKTHTEIIKRPFSSHCLKTLHSILFKDRRLELADGNIKSCEDF